MQRIGVPIPRQPPPCQCGCTDLPGSWLWWGEAGLFLAVLKISKEASCSVTHLQGTWICSSQMPAAVLSSVYMYRGPCTNWPGRAIPCVPVTATMYSGQHMHRHRREKPTRVHTSWAGRRC